MKAMFIIIALVIAALAGIYYSMQGFDPEEQGKQAKAYIQQGQTWRDVCDNTKPPRKFHAFQETEEGLKQTGQQNFPGVTQFANMVDTGALRHGFVFEYYYSDKIAFHVAFGPDGKVTDIYDVATMADLLHAR